MITRLLVDELHLPADILDRWTDFELSQFLIHINCAVFGSSSSSLLYNDTPPCRCGKQCLYDLREYDHTKVLVCTHNPHHSFCRDCRTQVVDGLAHGPTCADVALEKLAGERRWVRCPRPSKYQYSRGFIDVVLFILHFQVAERWLRELRGVTI